MAKLDQKPDPDIEPNYDTPDVDYDDTTQASFKEAGDPEYDEGWQLEYDSEVADPDAQQGSQEYYKRSQK